MEIRKAKLEELGAIITLNKIVDYWQPDNFIKESIELWRVFVAIIEWDIVAFLLYQNIWGNTILLALLKVHSDFYSQGIGSNMLKYFESMLLGKWVTTYMSSTMLDNPRAQNFHIKNDFTDIWVLDMHYGKERFYKKNL